MVNDVIVTIEKDGIIQFSEAILRLTVAQLTLSIFSIIISIRILWKMTSKILKNEAIIFPVASEVLSVDFFEDETNVEHSEQIRINGAVTFPQYNGIYNRKSKHNKKYWFEHANHELYIFCSSFNGNWHIRAHVQHCSIDSIEFSLNLK